MPRTFTSIEIDVLRRLGFTDDDFNQEGQEHDE